MFVMHHYLVPGLFFMEKALGTRGQDRVATSQHSCWVRRGVSRAVTLKSGVAYFRIGEYI